MNAPQDPLISIDKASFGYGSSIVIRNVSMTICKGEFIGLVGPNGAGKTTLFRGILGLIPPRSGHVTRSPELARRIGYVPQRDQLDAIFPVTASDIVRMGIIGITPWHRFLDPATRKTVSQCLDKVGMRSHAERPFAELSGGQRQRVLMARALAINPLLMVLDEPTAGIDPAAEENILNLLDELHRRDHLTILMVSHRVEALRKVARKMIDVRDHGVTIQ